MIIFDFEIEVEVDYNDGTLWAIDDGFFNRHPLITRAHFPLDVSGKRVVKFRTLQSEDVFTTGVAISEIERLGLCLPNLAETRFYHRNYLSIWKEKPLLSLCGARHQQGGEPFIAYVQGQGARFNLFFNWMGFKREPTCVILAVSR